MSKKIQCLVVDDEPLAIALIKKHIEMVPELECVGSCVTPMEAFSTLRSKKVDLIFLDIQMPVISGIEFVKSLEQRPAIIFTTAYREYAVESYELEVVDYLLKPIGFVRFFKAVNKYLKLEKALEPVQESMTSKAQGDYIFVNVNRKNVKIHLDEILYIESLKDYLRIHIAAESIVTKEKISEFINKLPRHFLRVHRSFIVNMDQVTAYSANDIEIDEKEIPIGISYKREVIAQLKAEK